MNHIKQPLRIALLSISMLIVWNPATLSAGCGGGSCGPKRGGGGGGYNHGAWLKQQRERAARRTERLLRIEILNEYMDPIDTNNDGSISRDEFVAYEGSDSAQDRFDEANKNGDRYLTKSEIAKMIDIDEEISKRKKS